MGEIPLHGSSEIGTRADQPATARQLRYLSAVAREAGLDAAALDARSQLEFGCAAHMLGRRDASTLIQLIQAMPHRPDTT